MLTKKPAKSCRLRKSLREIMSGFVESIRPHASVQEASARMRAFDVGFLPVLSGGEILGVLTDRDITLKVTAEGKDASKVSVGAVMTAGPVQCGADCDVREASRLMRLKRIRRLLLVGPDGRLAGILSLADLARNGYEDEAAAILTSCLHASTSRAEAALSA